jgi:hypothetical protein
MATRVEKINTSNGKFWFSRLKEFKIIEPNARIFYKWL